ELAGVAGRQRLQRRPLRLQGAVADGAAVRDLRRAVAGRLARVGTHESRAGMSDAIVIAIVGAESTGKTALAGALAARVAAETGPASTWVPEQLRAWCERAGRTPRIDEQAAIAALQRDAIDAAAAAHDVVIADTTPLMIATYSRMIFDDDSLI